MDVVDIYFCSRLTVIYLNGDDICKVSFVSSLSCHDMRSPREIVLLLPGHTECCGQPVRRVSHRLVGRELSNSWQLRVQEVGTEFGEQSEFGADRFSLGSLEHELSHLPRVSDWNIRHKLYSTSNTHIIYTLTK